MKRLFTSSDVAQKLWISPSGVSYLARNGDLPVHAETPSGVRLFDPAAIERVLVERGGPGGKRGPAKAA